MPPRPVVEAKTKTAQGSSALTTGVPAATNDGWLLLTLEQAGLLTTTQSKDLERAGAGGIWSATVKGGFLTDQQILGAVSSRFKVPIADLGAIDMRVSSLIPESVARKYQVIPITADDRTIRIATSDPHDFTLEQTLAFVAGREVVLQAASPTAIAVLLTDIYNPDIAISRLVVGLDRGKVEAVQPAAKRVATGPPPIDTPLTRLVDAMISEAVREGASDIDAEPSAHGMSIKYRIDGIVQEVMRLPAASGPMLVRRVKIMAKLDVADPLRSHNGQAEIRVDGRQVGLRVSTVPGQRGEKVVIRILDEANLQATLNDLQLLPSELDQFRQMLGTREGIVLLTGPAGSGKRTMLYAALNQLRNDGRTIVNAQDPARCEAGGTSAAGAGASALSNALRSGSGEDSDVILIGEICDASTAATMIQAGSSGHLVLATLETDDAPSAVLQLRHLGVDDSKLGPALRGIVAQRLVRRLCRSCATPSPIDDLPMEARPTGADASLKRAVGCKACGGTGYKGRMPVLEVLSITAGIAALIGEGALPEVLVEAARASGMRTLWDGCLARMWRGDTSYAEARRVLGERHEGRPAVAAGPVPASEITLPTASKLAQAGSPLAAQAGPPAPARQPETEPVPPLKSGAGVRVLIADDDRQMRRLLRSVLEHDSYEVVEAADGLEALELVDSRPFDLMILDINMPRLDGLGVLEELRARVVTSSIPVIVLTSLGDDTETRVFDLGAQDFLRKPVQPASLQARVRAVLRRSQLA
ncbi:MAG: ATPase, T2SS/T4P/T4SS family [Gemmatimonadota bacterium]